MKSLQEWRDDQFFEATGLEAAPLRRMAGATIQVPQGIRAMLRDDLIRMRKMYPDMSSRDMLLGIMAAVAQLFGNETGSKLSIEDFASIMQKEEPEKGATHPQLDPDDMHKQLFQGRPSRLHPRRPPLFKVGEEE